VGSCIPLHYQHRRHRPGEPCRTAAATAPDGPATQGASCMRGQGSLYSLLGKDITKRRKLDREQPSGPAAEQGWRAQPQPRQPTKPAVLGASKSVPAPSLTDNTAAAEPASEPGPEGISARAASAPASLHPTCPTPAATPTAVAGSSPLKPGNVRCPVCNCQLPLDDEKVNSHIGELQGWSVPCIVCAARLLRKHRTCRSTRPCGLLPLHAVHGLLLFLNVLKVA
jgi:hypothetical protein